MDGTSFGGLIYDTMLKFDLISIQFALHYAFQTENKLLNLISTLKTCTQPGSILLILCVRDDYIYDRMSREGKIVGNTDKVLGFEMYNTNNVNNPGNSNNSNNNNNSSSKDEAFNNTSNNSSSSNSSSNSAKKSKPDRVIGFENSLHSLRFKFNIWNKISTLHTKYRKEKSENERLRLKENASKEEEGNSQQQNLNQASQQEKVLALIGIPYVYFQQDSVNHIEEYMISFEHLCKMLEVHVNMKKIFDQPFDQLVDKYSSIRRFEGAFTKRKLHERKPTKDELQVISMYRMCMFERL